MANRWGNNGNMTGFIFWCSKITADADYSHEIKRPFLLGRKAITNIDSILKTRNTTLLTKVHLVKAMVFPVVMYRYKSWTNRRLSSKELMLLKCSAEDLSLEQQGDQISNPKGNQPWVFTGRTNAEA